MKQSEMISTLGDSIEVNGDVLLALFCKICQDRISFSMNLLEMMMVFYIRYSYVYMGLIETITICVINDL